MPNAMLGGNPVPGTEEATTTPEGESGLETLAFKDGSELSLGDLMNLWTISETVRFVHSQEEEKAEWR